MSAKKLIKIFSILVFLLESSCSNYTRYQNTVCVYEDKERLDDYHYVIEFNLEEHMRHSLHAMEFFINKISIMKECIYVKNRTGLNKDNDIRMSDVYDIPVRGSIFIDKLSLKIDIEMYIGRQYNDTTNKKWVKYDGNGLYMIGTGSRTSQQVNPTSQPTHGEDQRANRK